MDIICGRFCFFCGNYVDSCKMRDSKDRFYGGHVPADDGNLLFSWLIVWIVGSGSQIAAISGVTLLFLVLSGAATGASWLCYFRALQTGDINKVVPH